jgi:hypothetical protein
MKSTNLTLEGIKSILLGEMKYLTHLFIDFNNFYVVELEDLILSKFSESEIFIDILSYLY